MLKWWVSWWVVIASTLGAVFCIVMAFVFLFGKTRADEESRNPNAKQGDGEGQK